MIDEVNPTPPDTRAADTNEPTGCAESAPGSHERAEVDPKLLFWLGAFLVSPPVDENDADWVTRVDSIGSKLIREEAGPMLLTIDERDQLNTFIQRLAKSADDLHETWSQEDSLLSSPAGGSFERDKIATLGDPGPTKILCNTTFRNLSRRHR